MQRFKVKGLYVTIKIESKFSKHFNKGELTLMAIQMLKASLISDLATQIKKLEVK